MSTADIVILVVLLLPALIGVLYGFLNIVFSIAAWVLALGISIKFSGFFSPLLASYVETEWIRDALAYIGVFIIGLMIFSALGYFIIKLLGRTGLTAADRILGLFFGFGLGAVIIAVIVFLAGFTDVPAKSWWAEAVLIEPFEKIAVWANQFLPDDFASHHSYDI